MTPTTATARPVLRLLSAALGLAMAASLLLAGPAQAATAATPAATDCATDRTGPTLLGISPTALSIGISPVTVAWAPAATDPCGIAGWAIYRAASDWWYFKATNSNPTPALPVPRFNYQAGWGDTWLSATDRSANRNVSSQRFALQLLRRTTFEDSTFDIIKPGGSSTTLSISAKLIRADWVKRRYDYFPGEHVFVQFKPADSDRWQHVQTLTTDRSARMNYRLDVRSLNPSRWVGQWRLRYLGGVSSASTTSATVQVSASPAGQVQVRQVAAAVDSAGQVQPPGLLQPAPASWATPAGLAQDACQADRTPPSGVQVSVAGADPTAVVGSTPVATRFTVSAIDPCGTGGWDLGHAGFGPQYPYGFSATNTSPVAEIPPPPANHLAGYSDLWVHVSDGSPRGNPTQFLAPIRLARPTWWPDSNVWLEPPTPGQFNHTMGIHAQLFRQRWDLGGQYPFAGQMVAVERLAPGATRWQHVKFARTDSSGWMSTRYWKAGDPAQVFSGQWRVRLPAQERYAESISRPMQLQPR